MYLKPWTLNYDLKIILKMKLILYKIFENLIFKHGSFFIYYKILNLSWINFIFHISFKPKFFMIQ